MADISQLSDADLLSAIQKPPTSGGLSAMSDADLLKAIGQPQPAPQSSTSGIGTEIYNAGKSAIGNITEAFNPYSATNTARMEQYKQSGPFDLSPGISGLGTVAKGIMGVPELASAPLTGAARATIGGAFDALSPSFSDADKAKLAQLGVQPATGRDVADTAMMGLRPAGASPVGLTTKPAPVPAPTDLKSAAVSGYDSAKNSGVEIKPQAMQNFTARVQSDLNADGINEVLAPKTFGVLDKLGNPPSGATVTTNDFRTLQRSLGMAAKSPDPTERLAASRAIDALNNHIENLQPADILRGTPQDAANVSSMIKEANANYSAYKRSSQFDLRGQTALNNAGAANSGMNLENQLRSQVRQILNNPKLQRGYDLATLDAFREFNRGSRTSNVVRAVGNVLGGGGGVVGTGMSAGAGMLAGGPIGAVAAPMAGVAVKAIGNRMALNQFDKLSQMIRANSPLARQAAPIPVGAPNPFLSGLSLAQLPPALRYGLSPMLGVLPSPAQQKQ